MTFNLINDIDVLETANRVNANVNAAIVARAHKAACDAHDVERGTVNWHIAETVAHMLGFEVNDVIELL